MKLVFSITAAIVMTAVLAFKAPLEKTIYDFKVKDIDDKEVSLDQYRGKVLLIVNVASNCGHTPQYKDLEELYQASKSEGLEILGFPCNQFLAQEPGSNKDIKEFCTSKYKVTFPMFSKVHVKGKKQDDIYKYLTHKSENGVLDATVKWNFQKFLIGRNGKVIASIAPGESIYSESSIALVKAALAK